ncbi:hypothetical protein SM124_07645 [Bacillus sp. 31A1R]|uniref:Uncharacterized protein n=1 Tax=Robertmurraya mangrovi TaxID=3098077 RepID=A0ABU5IWT9_9BACI|nr:hypothetical protein [Bacillus sp. 31A1R]MDZ5471620.1 hypothetical protein [Bacillus sp. 31A1R]
MEPRKPGNEKMPDFDILNDRMIAKPTSQPFLVIKTNLDPKDSTVDNPYYHGKETNDQEEFRDYFEEK